MATNRWGFAACGDGVRIYEPCIILRPEQIRVGDGVRVDALTKLEGGAGITIGCGVHISSFAHVNVGGGRLVVGDYAAITSGVTLVTGSNTTKGRAMSSAAPAAMQEVCRGQITIGACAFLGATVVVLPDVTIGEGAVIAAGAVVMRDVPPWELWAGNPARKMLDRPRPPGAG